MVKKIYKLAIKIFMKRPSKLLYKYICIYMLCLCVCVLVFSQLMRAMLPQL